MSAATHRIVLSAHPSSRSEAIQGVEVRVQATEAGILTFAYSLDADMARIRAAPQALEGRTDGLWKHTCFEAFIEPGITREPGEYYELNFSAARQWAAYRFHAYREGGTPLLLAIRPEIAVRRSQHRLELEALVRLKLGVGPITRRPKLALSAVIEEENGRLCYWAARHPPGKPDFHHPAGFVLEL